MGQWLSFEDTSRRWFWTITLAALLAAVAQVTLGGVVRVTESGLGCPDWPLCHGQMFPPLEFHALIEYFHRISATVLGLLVAIVTVMAWWFYREEDRITVPSTMALVLVIVAALLGGITVLFELQWWIVLIHLGVAECVVACIAITLVTSHRGNVQHAAKPKMAVRHRGVDILVTSTLIVTFFLVLAASYVVGQGYGSVCNGWPLCGGSIVPVGKATAIHMSHRVVVLFLGLLMVATTISVWRWSPVSREVRWVLIFGGCLYILQILVGAAIVWTDFGSSFKAFHLAMATLVWVSVVLLAAINFLPGQYVTSQIKCNLDNQQSEKVGT